VPAEPPADPSFRPPPWLRNAHIQSILPSLPLRRPGVRRRCAQLIRSSEPVVLECGDGVRLLGFVARALAPVSIDGPAAALTPAAPPAAQPSALAPTSIEAGARLAIILHGWEGSSDSMYVLSLGQYLLERGFDVFRLNLRDHGDSHHLNAGLFHSCLLPEVRGAVLALAERYSRHRRSLIGFSLGGNFALRVGASLGPRADAIARIVAVSPVLDPRTTLGALESGWPLYRRYFIRKWRRSLYRKQHAWPGEYDFARLPRLRTLTVMTRELVLRHTAYRSLEEYFEGYAITGPVLRELRVPSRVLISRDDPIIPARDLPRLHDSPMLSVTLTRHGGHCGFRDSLAGYGWVDRFVYDSLVS